MAHRQVTTKSVLNHDHTADADERNKSSYRATAQSMPSMRRWLILGGLLLMLAGCRPAQIGPSDEVLGAVDALYTAIASRRMELLDKSATRLDELRTNGELPEAAHRQLKSYVEKARAGKWDAAIRELHEFIRGQRRAKA